jgi:hypothetical protein
MRVWLDPRRRGRREGGNTIMDDQLFRKEAAFFPFVSAEIFFEAESDVDELDFDNNLDAELDEILKTSDLT